MNREKLVKTAREFCFGFISYTMIAIGIYAMRKGLNLGMIGSGVILLYWFYITQNKPDSKPKKNPPPGAKGSEIWESYLNQHPDLCPLCVKCPENIDHLEDCRCHNGSYRLCETYINQIEEESK